MLNSSDTIFAPASGLGKAGICIIRVSGSRSGQILQAMAGSLPRPRFLSLRDIRHPVSSDLIDKALIAWFPAPHSFTGEDQGEFHIHGGIAVRKAVLETLSTFPGCRLAEPGEFTRRAFINGSLDLSQVEGLADLIDAETDTQRRQALRQMDGFLARKMEDWRRVLLDASALCEALLDFSDEGDVSSDIDQNILSLVHELSSDVVEVLKNARSGQRIREGFVVAIMGPPNAGKSTLLNALAQKEAALVSPLAGTTRDLIEVSCNVQDIPVTFIDTAGLRDSSDPIETAGIERALKRSAEADLVLWLQAADQPVIKPPDLNTNVVNVLSKSDLSPNKMVPNQYQVSYSSYQSESLHQFLNFLTETLKRDHIMEDAVLTRQRHVLAVKSIQNALSCITTQQLSEAPELTAEHLRAALESLGSIIGRVGVENMLDHLFGAFCIGK